MARRNGFLDAIQSFNAAYDTVERVGKDFQEARIMRAEPEVSTGYTADQGEELQNAAAAGDHVGWDESTGAYAVTPRLGDGEVGPAQPRTVAPQQVSDFMGRRTAGTMTPQQVQERQQDALIDLETQFNPARGLQMRREASRAALDDERAARERKGWEREDEKHASEAAASDFAMGVMKNPDGEQARAMRTLVNRQGRDMSARYDPKTGATTFDFNTPDGSNRQSVQMTPTQMAQLAYGYAKLQRGDVSGLQVLGSMDKEFAAALAADLQTSLLLNRDKREQAQLEHSVRTGERQATVAERQATTAENRAAREATPKQTALADIEGALGRKLSQSEREQVLGMGKEESAQFRAKLEGLQQMNKNGQFQSPDAYGAEVDRLFQERTNERARTVAAGVLDGLKRAQANGELDKAIDQLRERRVPEDRIQELVKQVQAPEKTDAPRGRGLPPPTAARGGQAKSALQQAYDEWQDSKGSWFSQRGPLAAERERAAEQRYLELLRNPQTTTP